MELAGQDSLPDAGRVARVRAAAEEEIRQAPDLEALERVRVRYLGRKGEFTSILRSIGVVPREQLPALGRLVNESREALEHAFLERETALKAASPGRNGSGTAADAVDITLPGRAFPQGRRHPVSLALEEIVGIFERLGFQPAEGPQVESDENNFTALNIPPDHPARDMQATFFLEDGRGQAGGGATPPLRTTRPGSSPGSSYAILRTHTSPVQIRVMRERRPPLRIVAPGRVYRRDADVSHLPIFHQVEGFVVDRVSTFADLKGTLETFARAYFGASVRLRFRPSYFPFTEPSAEIDVSCVSCAGAGGTCRLCKGTGWLEILGAGMIHPAVFKAVGYPAGSTGFAFGMGVERAAMIRYGIDDIRAFITNDLRVMGG